MRWGDRGGMGRGGVEGRGVHEWHREWRGEEGRGGRG